MQYFKVFFIYICLLSTTIAGNQASPLVDINKSIPDTAKTLNKAVEFLTEDPQRALLYGHQALKFARLKDSKEAIALAYLILANSYLNIGDIDRATFYLEAIDRMRSEDDFQDLDVSILGTKSKLHGADEDFKEAKLLIERAIKLARSKSQKEKQIELLLLKANLFKELNQFEESIGSSFEAKDLAIDIINEELVATCYQNIGSAYYRQSKYEEAGEWYSKALDISRKDEDTLACIEILKNISIVSRDIGKFDESNSYLSEALVLAQSINNQPLIADVFNLQGSLSLRMGNHSQSINYYNQSLQIREQLGYLSSTAASLENLSRVYLQLDQFPESEKLLLKAISIRESINDYPNLASAQNDLGNVYSQQGDLAEALKFYLNSLKIRQERGLQTEIARSLTNIGITYRKLNSLKNALRYFDEALELIPEKTDPIGKAYVYIHQGNSLRDLNNPSLALNSYQRALELRKITGNQVLVAQAMRSVASAYSDMKRYGEAKKNLSQSLEIYENLNDQKGIAEINNELGNVLLLENDFDKALMYFEHAATIYGKLFDMERRGLCLRKIGEIQLKQGMYSIAAENLNLALNLAKATQNGKLLETTLLSLYDYHFTRGSYKEAIDFYQKHIEVRDSLEAINSKESVWQASLDLELDKKATEIRIIEGEVDVLRQEAKVKAYELERQKLMRNFFALGFLFIFILAVASVYGYLIIRKKNILLNQTNERLAESERELQSTVKTKDKLFSIIAHDLKSPFTALVGLTEILYKKTSSLNPEETIEYSGFVHESSQKLLTLIENLLDWSRSQTGKIQLEVKEIKLNEVFSQTLGLLQLQAEAKDISINVKCDEKLTVFADFNTIFTVVRNLVSNSIKFTEIKGSIWLSAYQNNSSIIIEVKDSGVGINPLDLSKLFKLEGTPSTKGTGNETGTGLGLIVCKEFVEMNKGKIWVESDLGKGTTFFVSLPSVKKQG